MTVFIRHVLSILHFLVAVSGGANLRAGESDGGARSVLGQSQVNEWLELPENPRAYDQRLACGPLCLLYLERLFGKPTSYDEVLAVCRPGPKGTSLQQLANAAPQLGLAAVGFEVDVDVLSSIAAPVLLHLNGTGEMGHFVVLLGYDDEIRSYHLFDPARGAVTSEKSVLECQASGRGLAFSTSPNISLDAFFPSARSWLWLDGLLVIQIICVVLLFVSKLRGDERVSGKRRSKALAGVVLLMGLASCAAQESGSNRPLTEVIDIGDLEHGAKIDRVHQFVNSTNEVVRITYVGGVEGTCSCQIRFAKTAPQNVMPGASVPLAIKIDTHGVRGPTFRKFVVKTKSESGIERESFVVVRANVRTTLEIHPRDLFFGTVGSDPLRRELVVESDTVDLTQVFREVTASSKAIRIDRLEANPSLLKFAVTLAPEQLPQGLFRGTLNFQFANQVLDTPVAFTGRREADIYVIPAVAKLAAGPRPAPTKVVLRSSSRPIRIKRIDTPSGVVAKIEGEGDVAKTTHIVTLETSVEAQRSLSAMAIVEIVVIESDETEEVVIPVTIRSARDD